MNFSGLRVISGESVKRHSLKPAPSKRIAPAATDGSKALTHHGRLRASSYMEFRTPHAPPDLRKPARLRRVLAGLGYSSGDTNTSWVGSRPVLPDYLPAIGRLREVPEVFYAFGHQHIGLTLSAITAELVSALVAGRTPAHDLAPYSLERFG